ncbi:wall-associated receptor kinase 3-like, partial [Trifolium medium]|nr:wall-associated receptor kinase 3-like [Trifolium medium]
MCLCKEGNFTTHCNDYDNARHKRNVHVIAGTVTGISAFGALGIGG